MVYNIFMARKEDCETFDEEEFNRQLKDPNVSEVRPQWSRVSLPKEMVLRIESLMLGLKKEAESMPPPPSLVRKIRGKRTK